MSQEQPVYDAHDELIRDIRERSEALSQRILAIELARSESFEGALLESEESPTLGRIADAAERIATALESIAKYEGVPS